MGSGRMRERDRVKLPGERCPYCHEEVERGDADKVACNACMGWHHQACWVEHGACAACGAGQTGLESVAPSAQRGRANQSLLDKIPRRLAMAAVVLGPIYFLLGVLRAMQVGMGDGDANTALIVGSVAFVLGMVALRRRRQPGEKVS